MNNGYINKIINLEKPDTIDDITWDNVTTYVKDITNNVYNIMYHYTDMTGTYTTVTGTSSCNSIYNMYYTRREVLQAKMITKTTLVSTTEEKIEEYILDEFDKYYIIDMGHYVYEIIREKAYDIASKVVDEAREDYEIPDEENVIEAIIDNIDFDSLYDLMDSVVNAPCTMEEKLAEVGMSYNDFL